MIWLTNLFIRFDDGILNIIIYHNIPVQVVHVTNEDIYNKDF